VIVGNGDWMLRAVMVGVPGGVILQ
jgi:hypothetical protein